MIDPEREFTEAELDAQIALVEEKLAGRKLDLYKPYPKQELFHRLGGELGVTDRVLLAGNQCNHVGSSIDLPRGGERRFYEMLGEQDFDVRTWDGVSRSTSQASAVFLRGIEPTYRLVLSNGRSMYCSARHQLLTVVGWHSLHDYAQCSSGWRCQERAGDSMASYATDTHRCDEHIRRGRGIGPVRFPSRDDVLEHKRYDWHADVTVPRLTRILNDRISFRLPTSVDDPNQLAALCEQFSDPTSPLDARWPTSRIRDVQRSLFALDPTRARQSSWRHSIVSSVALSADQGSSVVEETIARYETISRSLGQSVSWCGPGSINLELLGDDPRTVIVMASRPPLVGGVEILAIQPIGIYPIFDIEVKQTHNYISAGIISHNCGKSLSAAAETAMHLCGQYPDWWRGKRFPTATRFWVGSPTTQTTRDAAQMLLMGPPGEFGTGFIPARSIVDYSKATHGVPNSLESVIVKHVSGKHSQVQFKSYDQGRIRWQAATINGVWYDEEPPMDIYVEGRTRTNVPGNFTYMTCTPLLGMSDVMIRFLKEKPTGSIVVPMTIDDALHYTPEQRKTIVAGYPAHERKARAQGIPILGSGAVFPIEQEQIETMPFAIPDHWPRLCGMDFGWDHPTACVWLAWDRDTDTIYVYDSHRVKEQTPIVHAATMKAKGAWIPVAWPHDGLAHDKGSGAVLAQQYRNLGVNMMKEKATHKPEKGKKEGSGGFGVEAGISEILQRMQTGRFKVFSNLNDWFDEYRMYYRKDGLIVKEHDDLMSATRVGVMMLRFAKLRRQDLTVTPKLPGFTPSYSSTGVLG